MAMTKVLISYRRIDSADVTGRIYDHLAAELDKENLFKDVDSIPLGVDFRTAIANALASCDVVLAVIGQAWLQVKNEDNYRRLDDPDDFVRIELETALERGIPIIPVLVGGAIMPAEDDLPPSLRQLAYRNGVQIRPDPDFKNDTKRLLWALKSTPNGDDATPKKWIRKYSTVIALVIVALVTSVTGYAVYSILPENSLPETNETQMSRGVSGIIISETMTPDLESAMRILSQDTSFGYHYLVDTDGSVHALYTEREIAFHASGNNRNTIGIGMIHFLEGLAPQFNQPYASYSEEQINGLVDLLAILARDHELSITDIRSKQEIYPNLDRDITEHMDDIRIRVGEQVAHRRMSE